MEPTKIERWQILWAIRVNLVVLFYWKIFLFLTDVKLSGWILSQFFQNPIRFYRIFLSSEFLPKSKNSAQHSG